MNTEQKKNEYMYRSKLPDIQIPDHLPLHEYCFQRLGELRDKPFLIEGSTGKIYSYGQVHLIAHKIASGLAKLGLKQGEVVMLLVPNCAEFVFLFLGTSIRGAILTPANPLYTAREVANQANSSGARIIVTLASYVEKLSDLKKQNLIVITIDRDDPPPGCLHISVLTEADEKKCPSVHIRPDDVVALPYSSGTTGLPKGVMLTHKSLVSTVSQQVDGENPNYYLHQGDVCLCLLPLYHIYSLVTIFLCSLKAGAALVIMQKFNIGVVLEYIQKHRITVVPLVPPAVSDISKTPLVLNYDVSSVRRFVSGGSPILDHEVGKRLRDRFPNASYGQGYGMTEANALAMSLAFAKKPFPVKPNSCGTVVRNSRMKIIDLETGQSLPHNQKGEICIRGPQIMKGYINDPEATRKTIDEEGWLHTGDIGFIDSNEEIFMTDRLKELIKYKGYQVAPAEIEGILQSHPSIADAAVTREEQAAVGEIPIAFVVKANGAEISEEEIKHFVAKRVVFYKKLHKIYFVNVIPKSPSGKILRNNLKANNLKARL
eukprot:PITA_05999